MVREHNILVRDLVAIGFLSTLLIPLVSPKPTYAATITEWCFGDPTFTAIPTIGSGYLFSV